MPSPPFKGFKPGGSACKPIFSGENSALDQTTNNSNLGQPPIRKGFSQHKYFSSNVPSTHRTQGLAHQPGYEVPLGDFVTGVDSIRP